MCSSHHKFYAQLKQFDAAMLWVAAYMYFRFKNGKLLTPLTIGTLNEKIPQVSVNETSYKGHRFHAGDATTEAQWSMPDTHIKMLG